MTNTANPLVTLAPPKHTLPEAYRQWARQASHAGLCMQVAIARDLGESEKTPLYLAEVLTRATFETALAIYFDGVDSKMDLAVRRHITELFGPSTLARAEAAITACSTNTGGTRAVLFDPSPNRPTPPVEREHRWTEQGPPSEFGTLMLHALGRLCTDDRARVLESLSDAHPTLKESFPTLAGPDNSTSERDARSTALGMLSAFFSSVAAPR